MTDKEFLAQLNAFFARAAAATYAGSGPDAEPLRPGFRDLTFEDGDWHYRDSYAGYLRSAGQEVIWHDGEPRWVQSYGGGMEGVFAGDRDLAAETFVFLKQALTSGDKQQEFQPRGPRLLEAGPWCYRASWEGDIRGFAGQEEILRDGTQVFTHDFIGGLLQS